MSSAVREQLKSFVIWVSSAKSNSFALTHNNTQSDFTIDVGHWRLPGTWSVEVVSAICSEVDNTKTKGDLMVYASFVEPDLVGHGMFPLVDRITYTGHKFIRHQETEVPFLRRVNTQFLQRLNFIIADGNGKAPVWLQASPTLFALQFKPRQAEFNENIMDQTFVSNQSRSFFPNNMASNFTAVLPSQRTLTDFTRWRMAITKITLPPVHTVDETKSDEWNIYLTPTFNIKAGASTMITITKVKDMDELISQFNLKMKTMIEAWFPQPDDAGLGGSKKEDRQIDYCVFDGPGPWPPINLDGSVSKYPESSLDIDELRTIGLPDFEFDTSPSDNDYRFCLRSKYIRDTDGATGLILTFVAGGILKTLGFTTSVFTRENHPNDTVINNLISQRQLVKGTSPACGPAVNEVMLVGCRLVKRYGKTYLVTSFFDCEGKWNLTLNMPEGFFDLLNISKQSTTSNTKDTWPYLSYEIIARRKDNNNKVYHPDDQSKEFMGNWDCKLHTSKDIGMTTLRSHKTTLTPASSGFVEINTLKQNIIIAPVNTLAHVTCSLVDFQQVGNKSLQLMEVVGMSAASTGAKDQPKQYVFEPKHTKFLPLITSSFKHITFKVDDEDNNPILFNREGISTISVRFKKE